MIHFSTENYTYSSTSRATFFMKEGGGGGGCVLAVFLKTHTHNTHTHTDRSYNQFGFFSSVMFMGYLTNSGIITFDSKILFNIIFGNGLHLGGRSQRKKGALFTH